MQRYRYDNNARHQCNSSCKNAGTTTVHIIIGTALARIQVPQQCTSVAEQLLQEYRYDNNGTEPYNKGTTTDHHQWNRPLRQYRFGNSARHQRNRFNRTLQQYRYERTCCVLCKQKQKLNIIHVHIHDCISTSHVTLRNQNLSRMQNADTSAANKSFHDAKYRQKNTITKEGLLA